jgi:omega-amidase
MAPHFTVALAGDTRGLDRPEQFAGADLLVFPELASGSYARLAQGPVTPSEAAEQISSFRRLSAALRCTVAAGSLALPGGKGTMTNSALVFSRGRKIHRYDKIHLFRPCNDHVYFTAGRTAGTFVFRTADGTRVRAGVEICFDLRFPELARMMALQGMAILFVPARWPRKRDDAWRTLLKARAIENQIFVVGCNAVGEEGGNSYVFDPSGEELLSTAGDPEVPIHTVGIDLGRIAHAQRLHRNLKEAVVLRRLAGKRR